MERLYYNDSYLCEFTARVIDSADEGRTVYLDRTAFYPSSGGQPHDLGTLGGLAVLDVVDEEERIAHRLAKPWTASSEAHGSIDWDRRFDHMQQHTGQHLLSAVMAERFGMPTVSFHLGDQLSTIDVKPKGLTPERLAEVERWANQEIAANRPVAVAYEEAGAASGLRKESDRAGTLRIVSIEGLDRSACGGTHVRATGEIGMLLLGKTEKVRDTIRIEFVCGGRALCRARRDYDALAQMARLFSCTLDGVPAAVAALHERAAAAEKESRLLRGAEASRHGRELYLAADGASGLRFVHRTFEALGEDARAEAQAFTSMGPGVYVASSEDPPAVLIARGMQLNKEVEGSVDVGAVLKEALARVGGRGGGTALLAQGRVPRAEDLMTVVMEVRGLVAGT